MQAITSLLTPIPPYDGQEPPDNYYNKINQVCAYSDELGTAGFNNGVKT
jgi:hypothetical protein